MLSYHRNNNANEFEGLFFFLSDMLRFTFSHFFHLHSHLNVLDLCRTFHLLVHGNRKESSTYCHTDVTQAASELTLNSENGSSSPGEAEVSF